MRVVPDACVRGVGAWPPVRRLIKRERRLRGTPHTPDGPRRARLLLPTYGGASNRRKKHTIRNSRKKKKLINYDIVRPPSVRIESDERLES